MNEFLHLIPAYDDAAFDRDVDVLALRKVLEWSQDRMANHIGSRRSTVARWENGAPLPEIAKRHYWRLFHEVRLGWRHADSADCAAQAQVEGRA